MESLKDIKIRIGLLPVEEWEYELPALFADSRQGVRNFAVSCQKKLQKLELEKNRIHAIQQFEQELAGGRVFAGIDEAGRGPLAGPVVAGAVIMPVDCPLLYVNDSKKLSAARREELFDQIMDEAEAVGIGIASPGRIDEINILQATYEAMREAVSQLETAPEMLINDAVVIPGISLPQKAVIKGDAKCYSIGAASIIAKVTRDRMMRQYDTLYPGYGFADNKGYGSAAHIAALKTLGACPIHRRSFITHFEVAQVEE
ncbi:MAG: ribonuclease HII [Lachnospiraceae bacterium]|nr:ribonuclease HII [Lachnospiraceae bacterium]